MNNKPRLRLDSVHQIVSTFSVLLTFALTLKQWAESQKTTKWRGGNVSVSHRSTYYSWEYWLMLQAIYLTIFKATQTGFEYSFTNTFSNRESTHVTKDSQQFNIDKQPINSEVRGRYSFNKHVCALFLVKLKINFSCTCRCKSHVATSYNVNK